MKKIKQLKRKDTVRKSVLLGLAIVSLATGCTEKDINVLSTKGVPTVHIQEPTIDFQINDESTETKSTTEIDGLTDIALHSQYVYLKNMSTDTELLKRNEKVRIYPASLTKVMTAIVAIEELSSLSEEVYIQPEIFDRLFEENASMAGFKRNEVISAEDALYGILLPSGAEASTSLAVHIAGSEENFVSLLNEKAKELEMNDTHFTNVTGLHNDNHFSTAKDLATLTEYALENPIFKSIFTDFEKYVSSADITLLSTLLQHYDKEFVRAHLTGGKTGYTSEAGLCLASTFTINNEEYLLITAAADGSNPNNPLHIEDAINVKSYIENNLEL